MVGDKELSKNTKVDFGATSVSLETKDQTINIQLNGEIVGLDSVINPFGQKLELKLKKAKEGVNWMSLEPGKATSI